MKRRFLVPREEETQQTTALQYLHRAWPEGTTDQIRTLFDSGDVEADDIALTRPDSPLAAHTVVQARIDETGDKNFGIPEADALLWGDDWVVVDKPVGVPGWKAADDPTGPVRFLADVLGIDRDGVTPVWTMPTNAGGPWLVAKQPAVADRLGNGVVAGDLQTTWVALIAEPARPRGRWETERGELRFAVARSRRGLAEVQLTPRWADGQPREPLFDVLLQMMADAGFPALGDAAHGGYLVDGAVRLRLQALYGTGDFGHSWSAPRDWWPEEPVVPAPEPAPASTDESRREIRNLQVAPDTIERLDDEGHPWILRDELRQSIDELPAGSPVELVGPGGPSDIYALVDGTGPIAARLWSRGRAGTVDLEDEIHIRLDEAIGRRRRFFRQMGTTDVFRVVHGEADGLPGLFVDRFGPVWRVTTAGRCARGFRDRVYDILHGYDPKTTVVEVEHLTGDHPDDRPPETKVVRAGPSAPPGEAIIVREADFRLHAHPASGIGPDLMVAHRDNRRRALDRAQPDEHWLDIRGRTGGFAALLAAADVETTNVDPDGHYFDQLDANLELNDVPLRRCDNIEASPLEFLDETDAHFDGILVDLTILHRRASASGGETSPTQLLVSCLEAMSPGASLFVCRPPVDDEAPSLEQLVDDAAQQTGRQLDEIEDGPPSDDFPAPPQFPQATAFEAIWAR